MTQPAYPPYQQPMRPMMGVAAPPKRSKGGVTSLLAGLLALVVAGLAVGGAFGAITTYRDTREIDGDTVVFAHTNTWWGFNEEGSTRQSGVQDEGHLFGLTLVLAATLLVLGAVFAFVAAGRRRPGAVAGSLISAGVGVLAGVVMLQLIAALNQMSKYNERELEPGESLEFAVGLGLWLPLGGVVLGIVAVVLALVGQRAQAVRVEPNTPRMGFPAPYGYRPQRMPMPERPTDVQPPGDDATTTQRVSGATASGTFAPVTPPAPPAPITPATTSVPDTQTTAPASKPVLPPESVALPASESAPAEPTATHPTEPGTTAEPGTTPPAEPATTAEPGTTPPAAPANETAVPGQVSPQDATEPALPAEPGDQPGTPSPQAVPAQPPTGPASEPVTEKPTDVEPPAAPTAEPGERSALSDFPAAPPAPELSPDGDNDRDNDRGKSGK